MAGQPRAGSPLIAGRDSRAGGREPPARGTDFFQVACARDLEDAVGPTGVNPATCETPS